MADYKQIAVWNERRFREKCDILEIDLRRYRTLLFNAISILEDQYDFTIEDVVEELGLRKNEYDNIMYGDF